MITESQEKLAKSLIEIGAIKFGEFRLKLHEKFPNAPLSPIYIDLRLLRSSPATMKLATNVYKVMAQGIQFDILADIPTAATPITAILSYVMNTPMISPRMDKKAHGITAPIDGCYKTGDIVMLIDDLITKADSKLEVIEVLENHDLTVRDLLVLVDREQGGVQMLQEKGYTCHCAYGLMELLKFYHESSLISGEDYEKTVKYLKNN